MSPFLLVGILVLVAAVALLVWIKVLRICNSPAGERYQRLRMQGPFRPLSSEEIAEDDRRVKSEAKASTTGPGDP
jgi:hypothetical protein